MRIRLSTPSDHIRLDREGGVGRLVIANEVRRNAVSLAMWKIIPEAIAALEADPAVRVILIRGAGETAFVSGADISEFATVRRDAASGRAYEAANEAAFAAIAACAKPTIAVIHGACMGGGLGIALACDLRLASDEAFFSVPAARLGVGYPPIAMRQVVATVGPHAAKMLFFTADRIDAPEALRLGLVYRLSPKVALDEHALALAETIAANAPLTIKAAKAAIDAAAGSREIGDDALVRLASDCFDSADYAEGCAAFLEKRKPVFTGQ